RDWSSDVCSSDFEAEGSRQAAILEAEGFAKAAVLRAEGEASAITTVFKAIHDGNPDPALLAYQYLLTLPKIAEGEASKLWIIPSDRKSVVKGISNGFFGGAGFGNGTNAGPPTK